MVRQTRPLKRYWYTHARNEPPHHSHDAENAPRAFKNYQFSLARIANAIFFNKILYQSHPLGNC
ncbi:hypothetical protein SAMN05216464_108107 [Mucilaginibacter pineti]|uniref:Uncharacterized protein n=1 Tax=Mucilaginibacter pineti TaxID=1391627 RepID=A0A1G7EPS6_9SPHI|nr:hypothetical protein SAMN05216464_108107 [Mucilaginibacter pineti]